MANEGINRVAPLSELDDYKVADGDPDIRGWSVTTERGDRVGEVDDLIVDTGAMKVRYIAVDLDERLAGSDRKVLVPIGAAQLDDEQDRVLVVGISPDQFATLPEYRREAFDREYETALLGGHGRASRSRRAAHRRRRDW
ncbi:MAG TPA: PRC-barrel domain-containing protein [Gemmatimonadaceae bacterium]|nr:PRC-barrel domain-containing protein [Gemmatimonadaceae bacterium]